MRENDVIVNDVIVNDRPKFQTRSPTEDDHCVIVSRDDLSTYRFPLSLRGTTSFIGVRKPTDCEIQDDSLERFELTYQSPDWEPGTDRFSVMEDCLELETAARPSTEDHLHRLGNQPSGSRYDACNFNVRA
jgi:hypothetical protein